jgi:ferredoxin--NADP+ reductase
MIATGTGIAPFASLVRDPETYDKFEEVILTNTCRDVGELAYGDTLVAALRDDPLIGELVETRLKYIAATTREESPLMGRITTRIEDGSLFAGLGVEPFDPEVDRVMICGSMDMLRDVKALVEKHGLVEGSVSNPGQFVVERAFVG